MRHTIKLSALAAMSCCIGSLAAAERPMNVIYILVDDMGYGDLGCYGQEKFTTPNIDKMASEGMRFTQHYAGCTVSAPSRCAVMTGLHTGHTQIRGNREIKPEGQTPMTADTYTLGKMFKSEGYSTGIFGKWGLGYPGSTSDPNKMGFDEFYGHNCQRKAHTYYPEYLWHNDKKEYLNRDGAREVYCHDLIHNHALSFIRENSDKPFFAMLTYTIPHAELAAPQDSIYSHYDSLYGEEVWQEGIENYKGSGYYPPEKRRTTFAAMVSRLDIHVGEILSELKRLGIDDNTLVIFTSDNGPHTEGGADPAFFNSSGSLRGVKRDLYEGGIRVPMIAWSPSLVEAGSESEHISAFWDVMPTFADMLDIKLPVNSDGISMMPTLSGEGKQREHKYMYWEFHEARSKQAVRAGDWKFIYNLKPQEGQDEIELFNLKDDRGEKNNLAEREPKRVKEFQKILETARTESELFKFGK